MNIVDVALVVLLLLCALRGTWRGVFRESFGFLSLIGGLWAALRGANAGALWLAARVPDADLNQTAVVGVAFRQQFVSFAFDATLAVGATNALDLVVGGY